jgi:penicillin-binding protein 2
LATAIAGLKAGFINHTTVIHCPGYHTVGRRVFRCHNRAGHGPENLIESIRDSCNVFFYERGIAMGIERIAETSRVFGLDQPTGIELSGETRRMLIPDPRWKRERFYGEGWFEGDTANTSIGQGFLLVTPLQMATFTASIARGETLTKPTLLRQDGSGRIDHGGTAIDLLPEQLELVLAGMRESGGRGTGRLAGSPSMPVAGKTGTAQVRKDGRPTTLAWFVGYSPAVDPRIAVVVLVEGAPEQETSYGGGATAAPIARELFRAYHLKHPTPGMLSAQP